MAAYDYSWHSLLRPGEGKHFFAHAQRFGKFLPEHQEYHPINGWWLAEISRLIYRRGEDEAGIWADPLSRSDILAGIGLKEKTFFNKGCIQFAIVSDINERFAVLVFRGTNRFEHWFSNLNTVQVPWPAGGLVHSGFKNEFFKIHTELRAVLSEIHIPLFYTGHSLGAALASLTASFIPPRAVYSFGSPKVGDSIFVRSLQSVPIYRVALDADIVTGVPPSRIPFDFCHAGKSRSFCFPKNNENSNGNSDALLSFASLKKFADAPYFLAAHSPVNYSLSMAWEADIFLSEKNTCREDL